MFKRIFSKNRRNKEYIEVDNESVSRYLRDGKTEKARWEHLAMVSIMTTDEGPFTDDVFWVLVEDDGKTGCVIPSNDPHFKIILERVQKLPGFDNEVFIKAMSFAGNNTFICWKKDLS